MTKLIPLRDILVAWGMFAFIPLILIDPDGSFWRDREAKVAKRAEQTALYAKALSACFNGKTISVGSLLVFCDVHEVKLLKARKK